MQGNMNINFINIRSLLPATLTLFCMFISVTGNSIADNSTEKTHSMDMPHQSNSKTGQSGSIAKSNEIYICPMHPDEKSHEAGSCSQCGMFLVKQSVSSGEGLVKMKPGINMPSPAMGSMQKDKQHESMSMTNAIKTERYWDNSDTNPTMQQQHNHVETDMSPRIKVGLPTISQSAVRTNLVSSDEHNQKHLDPIYICPMHPQIIQHEPGGNCPICGMNLVVKAAAVSTGNTPQVFLPASVIQNMGVRTTKVQRKIIHKKIHTQGLVRADDDRLFSVHPRTGGWIVKLHLLTEGDRIERKDELVDFFSPWINQVQLDYISALEEYDLTSFDPSRKTEIGAKVDALQNSLRLLNVMNIDIMRIKNNRKVQNTIQLLAPQGGIVTQININEGSYVEPYQAMFTIVDLSQVWIMVDVYEHQAPWVRKGNKVTITAPAIPARSWEGTIDYIYPQVDPKTRTLRARIALPNPDEALLLNMFVKVNIDSDINRHPMLTIPREAIIITGERQSVIKAMGKGHFQPVEVTTGKRGEGSVEILSGLKEGEEIVVSGQFLIDSESSLQASFLRMSE